jgi:hypothetical protein
MGSVPYHKVLESISIRVAEAELRLLTHIKEKTKTKRFRSLGVTKNLGYAIVVTISGC